LSESASAPAPASTSSSSTSPAVVVDDVGVAVGAGGMELVVRRAHCLFMLISVMRYNAGRPVKKDSNNSGSGGETTT